MSTTDIQNKINGSIDIRGLFLSMNAEHGVKIPINNKDILLIIFKGWDFRFYLKSPLGLGLQSDRQTFPLNWST